MRNQKGKGEIHKMKKLFLGTLALMLLTFVNIIVAQPVVVDFDTYPDGSDVVPDEPYPILSSPIYWRWWRAILFKKPSSSFTASEYPVPMVESLDSLK